MIYGALTAKLLMAAIILCHFNKNAKEDEYHIDPALFRAEYKAFKQAVCDTRKDESYISPLSGMKSAAKLFKGPHFGNLKRIYLFGRVAMLAATDNERTFSLYKEVETDRRDVT